MVSSHLPKKLTVYLPVVGLDFSIAAVCKAHISNNGMPDIVNSQYSIAICDSFVIR
jgi:hypothetical protein